MKIHNVNFNFDLSKPTDPQLKNLQWIISQLKQLGIEIVPNNKSSAATATKDSMGSNERLFLRLSGQQRMRTNGTDDREAFAAELVKERFPASAGELTEFAATPVLTDAKVTDDAAEEIDGNDLI